MVPPFLQRARHALAAWCGLVLLAGCGGAGEMGSGGTGAAAEGTVTGFGSIYVDGVRFDDSGAAVKLDNLNGDVDDGETKLGQRVEVAYQVDGVAQAVKIEPEVVGTVTTLSAMDFKVLGQSIVANADPAAGPVTQFDGGYTRFEDVQPTDLVEVHGVARTADSGSVIQATRVEKRTAPLPYLRVSGKVSALSAGPKFMLGALAVDASRAVTLPVGKSLAEGQAVVVLAPATALSTVGGTPTLAATRIRIRERASGTVPAYLGGVVSSRTSSTFNLGDVLVRTGAGTLLEPPGSAVSDSQYVQVRGEFNASGELLATQVKVRSNVLDADLRGTVTNYVAAAGTFIVRGVNVKIALGVLPDCTISEGQYVELTGRIRLGGVDATSIKCKNAPDGAVIERRGTAANVVNADNTFTLTSDAGSVTVRWTVLTFFADNLRRTQASLDGKALRVEGLLSNNNVLSATKIRLDH